MPDNSQSQHAGNAEFLATCLPSLLSNLTFLKRHAIGGARHGFEPHSLAHATGPSFERIFLCGLSVGRK